LISGALRVKKRLKQSFALIAFAEGKIRRFGRLLDSMAASLKFCIIFKGRPMEA